MMLRAGGSRIFSIAFCLVACGGGQPAAETSETPAPSEAPAPAESEPAAEAPAKADETAASEPSEGPAPKRSPKDLLTASGTLFSLSFKQSEPYQAAEAACSKKAGDNPEKKAECMGKARDKLEGESMFFKQEADGTWIWTTLRKSGAKVVVLHKVEFEFGNETATTVTLKPKGKDKGSKPKAFPAEVVIEVNDLGIEMQDPKLGKLVYEAKLGAVGDGQ
jgi:hypothetical protein